MQVVALTDHDNMRGVALFQQTIQAHEPNVQVFAGAELSTGRTGSMHILGYGMTLGHPTIEEVFQKNQMFRTARRERFLASFAKHNMHFSEDIIRKLQEKTQFSRPHMAQALVEAGYVDTIDEAFSRFLKEGCATFVPTETLPPKTVVEAITKANGIAVLAHPCRLELSDMALHALVEELVSYGLRGVEVYHPSASPSAIVQLLSIAKHYDLLVTGGSDCHGEWNKRKIGEYPSPWPRKAQDMQRFVQAVTRVNLQ